MKSIITLIALLSISSAALANGYDHRPTNSQDNRDSGACSIGYGCK